MSRLIDKEWITAGSGSRSEGLITECITKKLVQLKDLEYTAEPFPEVLSQVQSCERALYVLQMQIGQPAYSTFYHNAETELRKLDRLIELE